MSSDTKSQRREVLWNLCFQYLNLALMLTQGIALIPFYLRFLGAAEFGVWLMVSGVATWLSIIDPGISTLVQQRMSIALGRGAEVEAAGLARRGLALTFALAAGIAVCGVLASPFLNAQVDPMGLLSAHTRWWLFPLSIFGVALGVISAYLSTVGLALRQGRYHTQVVLVSAFLGIGSTIGMLFAGLGVLALPLGQIVRAAAHAGFSLRRVRSSLTLAAGANVHATIGVRTLGWSAIEKLVGTISMSADLMIIGRLFDSTTVSTYALTKRPVDMLVSLFQRPVLAISPTVSFLTGEGRLDRLGQFVLVSTSRVFWLVGFAVVGTALLLKTVVSWWVGPEHFLGLTASQILALWLGVTVSVSIFSNLYWASSDAVKFYRLNSALSFVTLGAMIAGGYGWGVTGLLVGSLLSKVLLAAWIFPLLACRALRLDAATKSEIAMSACAVALAAAVAVGAAWAVSRAQVTGLLPAFVGLGCYVAVLGLVSRRFRADLAAVAAGARLKIA
jgi:O-antigen/teichoic acid export membrane protein